MSRDYLRPELVGVAKAVKESEGNAELDSYRRQIGFSRMSVRLQDNNCRKFLKDSLPLFHNALRYAARRPAAQGKGFFLAYPALIPHPGSPGPRKRDRAIISRPAEAGLEHGLLKLLRSTRDLLENQTSNVRFSLDSWANKW